MKGVLVGAVLMFVLLPVSVHAVDYYVDVDSIGGSCSDSNNGRSVSSPWCTITRANSLLQAGDTVYIRAGIYSTNDGGAIINPDNEGSSGNPITYISYNSEEVIIRGQLRGAYINQNYITLDGLQFKEASQSTAVMQIGVLIGTSKHHVTVQNCVIENTVRDNSYAIRMYDHGEYHRILNNTISHIGSAGEGYGTVGDAIAFGATHLTNPQEHTCDSKYVLIEGNDVSYTGHMPITLKGKYNIVRRNKLHNPWETGFDMIGEYPSSTHPDRTYNVIEENEVYDAGSDTTVGYWLRLGMQLHGIGNIVRHNRIYSNHASGLMVWGNSGRSATYTYIFHNVFYNNGLDDINSIRNGITFSDEDDTEAIDNSVVKNNILYNNQQDGIYYNRCSASDITLANNHFTSNGNPRFVDQANYDFRLQSDSPCIDAGAFLTTTRSAGSGSNIPVQDASYFMDGFGIVEGDLIQFQGQTTTARITNVNYDTNTITVNTPLTWTSGQGVSLSYSGSAPDIGVYEFLSGEPPTPECGDDNCDPGETCSSCPQDCSCVPPEICCSGACSTPTCSQNSDCGSDPCKTYTCSNPGTCSSACSSQDKTSCTNDDGCCPSGCNEGNDNDCLPLGGPVAFWHFDEGSGDLASDGSGNANHGTIQGAAWTTGLSGSALLFDGINDYIDAGSGTTLDITDAVTMSAWVYPKILSGTRKVVDKNWDRYGMEIAGDAFRVQYRNDSNDVNTIDTYYDFPSANQWYFLTAVIDSVNKNVSYYVNGECAGDCSREFIGNSIHSTTGSLYVGTTAAANNFFNGTIDEVRIYDRALTPGEIMNNYNELAGHVRADINNDGVVDVEDLGMVATDFGKTSGFDPDSDTNSDGEVDIFDVVFVASRFT
ncbi:MAG: hypothetical protein GTN39_01825 [Candidatus Aenigmarchaeota archaeon]|nr:hypothetical protein [Candidatus Aenigmarchaeota archaeon]